MTDDNDRPDSMEYDREDDGRFAAKYELDEYSDLYDEYAQWVDKSIDKQRTVQRLQAGLRAWLHWCESNDVDPLAATESDVRRYLSTIRGHADHTITRRHATLSKYCHHLLTDERYDPEFTENPVAGVDLREDYEIYDTTEYINVLRQDDRKDIIALPKEAIEDHLLNENNVPSESPEKRTRDYLINALLWYTALRSEELARAKVTDNRIDFENRELTIKSAKLQPEKYERHQELEHRKVWWVKDLDIYMRRWLDSHRKRGRHYSEDNPYLFPGKPDDNEKYGHLNSSYLSRQVKRTAHNAGIQEPVTRGPDGGVKQWLLTAHRLRHSRITHLANETSMDMNALRMMAGHVDFDSTLRYVESDWDFARDQYKSATH